MRHAPLHELQTIADIEPAPARALTRRERLERWAEVLDREPTRRLKSLEEIELTPRADRPAMRADNSPLTVAYADPVLRGEGLGSDRLGDAMTFFGLSQGQAHRLLCSCMSGLTMEAGSAAERIRTIARGDLARRSAIALTSAAVVGIPGLLYLFG